MKTLMCFSGIVYLCVFFVALSLLFLQHPRMDRSQTMPNMRKPYENTYTKTYEGSQWRGAQDGNVNAERYGPKPTTPRFQANGQYAGHVQPSEAVQNGTDATGKPVRQPRPNTYQNRPNGTYVPRNNTYNNINNNNTAGTGGPHQGGPPYGVNPNPNGYQGNRGKPEVSILYSTTPRVGVNIALAHFLVRT